MLKGVTSASLIVVIVVAAAVGAGVGGILGNYVSPVVVALGSGFMATVVAVIVRTHWSIVFQALDQTRGASPPSSLCSESLAR
jgi:hypothetical protein